MSAPSRKSVSSRKGMKLKSLSLQEKVKVLARMDAGLGEGYEWHTLEEGLQLAQKTGKPLMLIIHKSWCGACKVFKPKFAASAAALELSKDFVMVNTIDSEEPKESKYEPDGGYIPRILFLDSKGEVQSEIYNKNGNPQYKFFYYDDTSVVESMRQARELLTTYTHKGNEL
ncbi:Thioredoxin domain-containing protein 12 [Chionoecetes opilio]|uniref:Thioredoxin domain-containing protein 12 n=1 Tax=Chionoecetes opilio TaxID=41210 RepID=A0A8J5CR73_CHIOP|nr:Thioredoxin domain-containing protein 12 [Chionoecetes opilio]